MICIRYYFEPIHNFHWMSDCIYGLYMICIRYYFEPIHNALAADLDPGAVVYDMYKILF